MNMIDIGVVTATYILEGNDFYGITLKRWLGSLPFCVDVDIPKGILFKILHPGEIFFEIRYHQVTGEPHLTKTG